MRLNVFGTHYKYFNQKVKIKKQVDLAYYNILFPEDVVMWGNRIEVVKEIICWMDYKYLDKADVEYYNDPSIYYPTVRLSFYKYSSSVREQCYDYYVGVELNQSMILHKRPLKNWLKFFWMIITKNYIK